MTISAQVVEDSIWMGRRITTLILTYPRFIHSEFMTHRVFSRNASSSRAIPFKRQLKNILSNPATFVHWGKNQPGMQAQAELEGWRKWLAQKSWSLGLIVLQPVVWLMELSGVHKQVINRMLEPWSHITVIVTATEWDNFMELRLHKDAQPEMHTLADSIKRALDSSKPIKRKHHLPFITADERYSAALEEPEELMMVSAARCARVSYLNHDGSKPDREKDFKLAGRLLSSKHMSPFEHQAYGLNTPAGLERRYSKGWRANFFGWQSYRNSIEAFSNWAERTRVHK